MISLAKYKNQFWIEKVAREGERCSGRMKCADGLRCVGKILEVDGQGTCRKSGNLLNLIALLSILALKIMPNKLLSSCEIESFD